MSVGDIERTLCGRIWNDQEVTIAKRLEEVSCVRCHESLKQGIEHALHAGVTLKIKHLIPAKMRRRVESEYAPNSRNMIMLVDDIETDVADDFPKVK